MNQETEIEEKRQQHLHNHALKGDSREVGAMPLAHDQEENNPNSNHSKKKKRLKEEFMKAVIDIAQEAFNDLMARLDVELETLLTTIKYLEKEMTDNREEWENKVDLLNKIDDVFCDMEDGGQLDRTKTSEIIQETGKEVPNGVTDAQMISLLQNIRQQTVNDMEVLDVNHSTLEKDLERFRDREGEISLAKQKLEGIGDDPNMSNAQRLQAIQNLDKEVGSKTLHAAATVIQDQDVSQQADEVVNEEIKADQFDNTANLSVIKMGLNF